MRNYEHFRGKDGEILLADPKSAKAHWGHNQPEYLEQDDPHFLRRGHTTFPHSQVVFQLTEPSPVADYFHGRPVGNGVVIVEEQQYSGWFSECGIHESKIVWDE